MARKNSQALSRSSYAEVIFLSLMQFLRPLLGPEGMCIFAPYTCTLFASDQLRHQPLIKAVGAITCRVLACNPLNAFWRARAWRAATLALHQKYPRHQQRRQREI